MPHSCPICAYPKLKAPPRSKHGGGSYEICPSCGFQFGVDDDDRGISASTWRTAWLERGAPWSSTGIKAPKGWSGLSQAAALNPSGRAINPSPKKRPSAKPAASTKGPEAKQVIPPKKGD